MELRARYGGQFIAIIDQKIMASGSTVEELQLAIQDAALESPLVTFVGKEEPLSWRSLPKFGVDSPEGGAECIVPTAGESEDMGEE